MAQRIVALAYGGPDVLSLVETDVPAPGPGEVTVRTKAIGTNPVDFKAYSGRMGDDPAALPLPLGREAAGVVTAAGPDAEGPGGPLAVGDEVVVYPFVGTYATEFTAPAADVVPKPPELSWEVAAGALLTGATALHAVTLAGAREGRTLLVHGASGGVGTLAVQLARAAGARVLGTASERRQEEVARLGATPLVYGPGLEERVRAAAPNGVDAAVDAAGTDEAIDVSLALVSEPVRIVSAVAFARAGDGITLIGGAPGADPGTEIRANAWRRVLPAAARGDLHVPVARTFPLAQAADAHRFLAEGHPGGKVILLP
jgi:NADPH:quinone reductase